MTTRSVGAVGRRGAHVEVGGGAVFGPGAVTVMAVRYDVTIGRAELGPGPVTVLAVGGPVRVGDGARLSGGCTVEGPAEVGDGAQVLGTVTVRDVVLAGGGGGHGEPDPDRRGAVVKGAGRVHAVRLSVGEVVVARTDVSLPERQRAHYPGAPRT